VTPVTDNSSNRDRDLHALVADCCSKTAVHILRYGPCLPTTACHRISGLFPAAA
jgi:hypothetical protein